MDKFYCTKCYYLTSEDAPPAECPICHSGSEIFDIVPPIEEQTIPEYWDAYLEEKIAAIHEKQIKAGSDSASFGLVTDLHWASNNKHSAAIMEKLLRDCSIPYFFTGGDIVCGSGVCPASSLERELREYTASFRRIEDRCLKVLGNHDGSFSTLPIPNYYAESLTSNELFNYYFLDQAQHKNRVFGPDSTYCYADDTLHKIRFITLNTHVKWTDELDEKGISKCDIFRTCGVMQEQIDWFASIALDVPSTDWTVVIASHEPLWEGWTNSDVLLGIVNAFRNHTVFETHKSFESRPYFNAHTRVDFTGRGGDVAIWIAGHTHADNAQYVDGILATATVNDSMHNSANSPFVHVKGTVTEQAIDIFTVDKKARKVYITRVGAGEDREFDY